MAVVKTTDTPSVCGKKSVEWWWWHLGPIYTANEKKMSLTTYAECCEQWSSFTCVSGSSDLAVVEVFLKAFDNTITYEKYRNMLFSRHDSIAYGTSIDQICQDSKNKSVHIPKPTPFRNEHRIYHNPPVVSDYLPIWGRQLFIKEIGAEAAKKKQGLSHLTTGP